MKRIVTEIEKDRSQGAQALAVRGLDALELLAGSLTSDPIETESETRAFLNKLAKARPSIASIVAASMLAVARAEELASTGVPFPAALNQAAHEERAALSSSTTTIAKIASREIGAGGVLVTCSWSATALDSIAACRPKLVRISQGGRLGDGVRAASRLSEKGLNVELLTDCALPTAAQGADAVLVGADQVLADGSVVNRCSTFSLALAASHFGVPFYAVCQRCKLCGSEAAEIERTDELDRVLPPGVTGRAPLFDVTPPQLVHRIVTENGPLTPAQAGDAGSAIAKLRKRFLEER